MHQRHGRIPVIRGLHRIAPAAGNGLEGGEMTGIIIHDQYFGGSFGVHGVISREFSGRQGISSLKAVPLSGTLSTSSRP